jgi:hypothetical protein
MKLKKFNSENIYLLLVLTSFFFLLVFCVDRSISSIQNKLENNQLENFENHPSPSSNFNSNILSSAPAQNNKDEDEDEDEDEDNDNKDELSDNSFLQEVENKEIDISNFYPSKKVYSVRSADQMWNFTQELDLFHQIIPKLKTGYLGIVNFDSRISGIYHTEDLSSKNWVKLERDMPEDMIHPIFISYDNDRMLLAIFEDKHGPHSLYKKDCTSLDSEWVFIEKSPVISFIYDSDNRLIGLDKKGNYFKKSNTMIQSEWEPLATNFEHIPMRQLLFDYQSGVMLGVGHDFRIYRKRYNNWIESDWGQGTTKSLAGSVRYVFYDSDGLLVGLSRVGLVKKKDKYYLNDFKMYTRPKNKNISVYKLIYAITGISNMAQFENNNNSNNVYVDGKKISEYKFKDKRLNKFLDYRMKVKKQCRKLKAMKIIQDNKKENEKEQIRNQKFSRILNEQKNTIDSLMDTIQSLKDSNF